MSPSLYLDGAISSLKKACDYAEAIYKKGKRKKKRQRTRSVDNVGGESLMLSDCWPLLNVNAWRS
jgi:hypothetical protein